MRELLASGTITFPEGPRWHDGALWLSDQLGRAVWRVTDEGAAVVAEVARPSGLGFLPDGSMIVASMADALVHRVVGDDVDVLADLRPLGLHLNDLVSDDSGRSYVDAYGADDARAGGSIVLVDRDGTSRVVAGDLAMPNGLVVTVDGSTLLVAETYGSRITAYAIDGDGDLGDRRVWCEVPGMAPDGLCLDAAGDVWVASFQAGEFLHVREGGEVLDRVTVPGRWAMACALGGADGTTLFLCSAETTMKRYFAGDAVGHLDAIAVDVPGVGRP